MKVEELSGSYWKSSSKCGQSEPCAHILCPGCHPLDQGHRSSFWCDGEMQKEPGSEGFIGQSLGTMTLACYYPMTMLHYMAKWTSQM